MESEVNSILVAAHELKGPLTTLRQLALALDYADSASIKDIQSEMVKISDRALRQISDLTKIPRLSTSDFEMQPVAIRSVCSEVVESLKYLYTFNNRSLNVDFRNSSRLIIANPDLLYSVIYNFCLNAMHYSSEDSTSELSLKDHFGKVRLSVRDFGPALPTDVYRSLKSGWLTRPTSISMRPGSSGLGLYIASKFSEYMNSRVGAIRHRNGTSFYVDFLPSRQVSLL